MATEGTAKRLTYNVFVRKQGDRYTATVVGFPNCAVEAASREEAIEEARRAVVELVSEGELVKIELETSGAMSSLRDLAGMWADDDAFDEFVDAMKSYRREVDAGETAS